MRTMLIAAAAAFAIPFAMIPLPVAAQQVAANPALAEVLEHSRRNDDRARDRHRHPAETLAFFQIEPGMTVVDYMPAGGWYSRILIPYLGSQGTYVSLNPELRPEMTGYWDMYRGTAEKFPAEARGWAGGEGARVIGANTDDVPDSLAATADRFLIFREIHNMRRYGWLHDSLVTARKLLKDGGLLGIEQHRAKADAPASYTLGDNGYLREKDVIAIFDAYGFDLVATSEINANPKDPANWQGGVWTLPPGYRGVGEDAARRAELEAIGESDRMTLLFRKRP
jgi:predicted methyltransferase